MVALPNRPPRPRAWARAHVSERSPAHARAHDRHKAQSIRATMSGAHTLPHAHAPCPMAHFK